jgi:hypothetical protein
MVGLTDRRFVKVKPTLVKRREPNRWSVKSNPTLARNREPDRRYAISSQTSAEERKPNNKTRGSQEPVIAHLDQSCFQ